MVLVAMSGCAQPADLPPTPPQLRVDIALGPPRFQTAEISNLSPLEQAAGELGSGNLFSFAEGSTHVVGLRLMLASPEGIAALAAIGKGKNLAGRLYFWCGLRASGSGDSGRVAAELARERQDVVVFDSDLHNRRTPAWVIRRATDTGFCESLAPAVAGDPWIEAERNVVRLKPSAFPDVPRTVRDDLEQRGCRIPQTPNGGRWQNIVTGRFTAARAIDWAALCSRDGVSRIVVYPNGLVRGVLELAREGDRAYLQQDADAIVFSRQISAATPAYIRVKNHPTLVPGLPRFDHDGINDALVGKASTVWFRSAGRWLKLLGAD